MRGRCRPDLLGELGELAVFGRGEDALLYAQFAQCDFQHFEIGDLVDHRRHRALMVVVMVVMRTVLGHAKTLLPEINWRA